jgi:hypothetical protein
MDQIKNIFNWFYERTALWIILFMGLGFLSSLNNVSIQSSKIEEGNESCKVKCSPSAYEYISDKKDGNCWCYLDKETLNLYNGE